VESYEGTINSIRKLYVAKVSLQINDTMRVLTIFTVILLPLTLIAGIYGMNGLDLNNLGELPAGFLIVVISMTCIGIGLLVFFIKKVWIFVSIAREYGLHHRNVLHKVLVIRQFTIYQLTNTILYDLPKRIQLHKPKVIVISGLLDQFYQDPYIHTAEVESLTSQIVTALHKIKDVFIILTSRSTDSQIEFPALSRIEIRAKQVFD